MKIKLPALKLRRPKLTTTVEVLGFAVLVVSIGMWSVPGAGIVAGLVMIVSATFAEIEESKK